VELISDPSVIMLDEPTSGLDSFRAREIVVLLHDLARKKGKTVVSTIHQPSSQAFFYFDRLIIMADGHIVYQGDAAKSPAYFRSLKYDMPKFANPADVFMKILAINYPKGPVDEEKIRYLKQAYRVNQERIVANDDKLVKLDVPDPGQDGFITNKASVMLQLKMLFNRSTLQTKREPRLTRAKIFQGMAVAMFMLFVFWDLDIYVNASQDIVTSNLQSLVGAIYFMTVVQMFTNFQPTIIVFQGEKPIFVRERASDLYDVWVYIFCKWLAEIPILLLVPGLQCLLLYWSIGF
jgi:ATP-binding cassette, subfamily G (WHITE), eye pigment precursor transporter